MHIYSLAKVKEWCQFMVFVSKRNPPFGWLRNCHWHVKPPNLRKYLPALGRRHHMPHNKSGVLPSIFCIRTGEACLKLFCICFMGLAPFKFLLLNHHFGQKKKMLLSYISGGGWKSELDRVVCCAPHACIASRRG